MINKTEMQLMKVFWLAGRPLSRPEAIKLAEDRTWSDMYFTHLVNSLMEKGLLQVEGSIKCGKRPGRCYAPTMSFEQYQARLIRQTEIRPSIAKLVSALAEDEGLTREEAEELEELLQKTKAERR